MDFRKACSYLTFLSSIVFIFYVQPIEATEGFNLQATDNNSLVVARDGSIALNEDKAVEKQQVGVVLSSRGDVKIVGADGVVRKGALKAEIFPKDRVETGPKAYVQVHFLDGSIMQLSGNSDFTVDDYVFDETQKIAVSKIRIKEAKASFLAGKISKIAPQNYKINTATATIGIRGSTGVIIANPDLTRVSGSGATMAPFDGLRQVGPPVNVDPGR
ncbi:MAG: FecR family protein, partial [Proteobacteria bacterium]|nr:FecR family protein [Pseudomonadota bacterium]